MELKVWVDGIQRVICGVSETTTCQDVVYALAHATGQTGRFTLVERWRHNERLLPPQEYPLKVLNKWGEYANDVQFILRRSHSDKKKNALHSGNKTSASSAATNPSATNKRQHELRSFSPTSPQSEQATNQNKLEIKKSLTFSGSHGGGTSGDSGHPTSVNNPALTSPKHEQYLGNHKHRADVPKGVVKGVPQQKGPESPSKAKGDRPKQPPSYDEAVSRSSRQAQSSQLHSSPSPITPSPISSILSTGSERDSPSNNRRLVTQSTHSSLSPSRNPHSRSASGERATLPQDKTIRRESPVVANLSPIREQSWNNSLPDTGKNYASILVPKSKKNLGQQFDREEAKTEAKETRIEEPIIGSQDPQFRDLIRLVNLQREKLNSQHAELSQYDSEIVYWENKLREQEERLATVEDEFHLLDKKNAELEVETLQLEEQQPLILEAIERGQLEDRSLRSKLSIVRAQLANCETEVLQCRQKLRQLLEELAEERRHGEIEHEEKEQEAKRQLTDLKVELIKHNEEFEKQETSLNTLEHELTELENQVKEKKTTVDKVTDEMKEANLQSLSMTISDDIKYVAEGGFFQNRTGSMRRIMGFSNARELENAVPTSKNPHGVWV